MPHHTKLGTWQKYVPPKPATFVSNNFGYFEYLRKY
jgi:hypothetical protein